MAIAALRSDKTFAQLAHQYDLHPNWIVQWKTQLQERATDLIVTAAERCGRVITILTFQGHRFISFFAGGAECDQLGWSVEIVNCLGDENC